MFKALRECKFDRKYFYGEAIPESVADRGCLLNAVKFGYIEEVKDDMPPVDSAEAPESTFYSEGKETHISKQNEVAKRLLGACEHGEL